MNDISKGAEEARDALTDDGRRSSITVLIRVGDDGRLVAATGRSRWDSRRCGWASGAPLVIVVEDIDAKKLVPR